MGLLYVHFCVNRMKDDINYARAHWCQLLYNSSGTVTIIANIRGELPFPCEAALCGIFQIWIQASKLSYILAGAYFFQKSFSQAKFQDGHHFSRLPPFWVSKYRPIFFFNKSPDNCPIWMILVSNHIFWLWRIQICICEIENPRWWPFHKMTAIHH